MAILQEARFGFFEIRYEFDTNSNEYKFKLFIESADSSRNGIYTNYYKMR